MKTVIVVALLPSTYWVWHYQSTTSDWFRRIRTANSFWVYDYLERISHMFKENNYSSPDLKFLFCFGGQLDERLALWLSGRKGRLVRETEREIEKERKTDRQTEIMNHRQPIIGVQ